MSLYNFFSFMGGGQDICMDSVLICFVKGNIPTHSFCDQEEENHRLVLNGKGSFVANVEYVKPFLCPRIRF